jgi:two-component system NtrC family sensor kinase
VQNDVKTRFIAVLLATLTLAAVICSVLNIRQELNYDTPTDGVWWEEPSDRQGDFLAASKIHPGSPGDKAGIKVGDHLVQVNNNIIHSIADLNKQLYKKGSYTPAAYSLVRNNVPLEVRIIPEPSDKSLNPGLRTIALIYLLIGLYVLLRRWTAPKSAHFYLFCLVSFVLYSYKFTGELNTFDEAIYWLNILATVLQPALFLHFALTFPEKKEFLKTNRWIVPSVYLPGLILLVIQIITIRGHRPSEVLLYQLNRVQYGYMAMYFFVAAFVLWDSYNHAETPIVRQQLKWVTRGIVLAIAPYTFFYVVPYLFGALPSGWMKASVLSLVILPLTFGYAIVRYRLMDVDLIFKRGMTYTLATAGVAGVYFALAGIIALTVQNQLPLSRWALVAAIVITALLFEPIKHWVQERLDKLFYRKRYDYRRTLIEFGRELSAETDLGAMLQAMTDRLMNTLLVNRIAIILATSQPPYFVLAKSEGMETHTDLDFSFLAADHFPADSGHLFFDDTRITPRETSAAQKTIAQLGLNYFIPCRVQNQTIAVMGLGKMLDGDFLSDEDIELLETLAGYLGIAIQNALLYASLEEKVVEYERLKDFNENIVESINVGIIAVDLDDNIESWNAQMEVLYATPRLQAQSKRLGDVFPPAFMDEYNRVRNSPGIHNLYKFRLRTPAGESRVLNIAIAPLVTRSFSEVGRLIIVDDITSRIDLEKQLTQAEKMSSIGLLAAGVAHEVNTPLAVISSYAQMLAKQLKGDEKSSALLEKITKQTFRASEIASNLLNFSRTSGAEFTDVDLNIIIRETLSLLEHQFKTARITVEQELCPEPPRVQGNSGKLQQVFLNLFLNARDAMAASSPTGGTLRIVTRNHSGVTIMVSDTGSGIAPEHIARIYDPFFTTKKSATQGTPKGTGLGLSVSYGIIQEHAGKIQVESTPGQGTTFHLEFPAIRKAQHV